MTATPIDLGPAPGDRDASRPVAAREDLVGPVTTALAVAALIELVVLRMTTRTAIHIPGIQEYAGPYQAVSGTGRLAYTVAVLLAAGCVAILARALWYRPGPGRVAAVALGVFFAVAAAAAFGVLGPFPVDFAVMGCVVAVAPAAVGSRRGRPALALWVGVVAFIVMGAASLAESAPASGLGTVHLDKLLLPGEILAAAAAIGTPLLLRSRPRTWVVCVAAVVGVVVTGAFLASPSTTMILVLWNFGIQGVLPALVYGLGAAAITVSVLGLWTTDHRSEAVALVLLVAAGTGLHSTYQSALVLCGLALFALAAPERTLRPA